MVSREISIMKLLNHPNVIRLYEVIDSEIFLFLVMEYAAGGEVRSCFRTFRCYTHAMLPQYANLGTTPRIQTARQHKFPTELLLPISHTYEHICPLLCFL